MKRRVEHSIEHKCARCGIMDSFWSLEEGHHTEGKVFCCEGCADDVGCICDEAQDERSDYENASAFDYDQSLMDTGDMR